MTAMDNINNAQLNNSPQEEDPISIRDILDLVWRIRYWIILSAAVCFIFGFFYVKMQTPVYRRSTYIMLNNVGSTGNELSILSELAGAGSHKRIDNEIFILKSSALMEKVVTELDLNTRYYHFVMPVADRTRIGRGLFAVKQSEYYKDNPYTLTFHVDSLYPTEHQPSSFSVEFQNCNSETFVIRELILNGSKQELATNTFKYGEVIPLSGCTFSITVDVAKGMVNHDRYLCTWSSPYATAKSFAGKIRTDIQSPIKSRQSDVLMVSMDDPKPSRATDILNTLVVKANDDSREYSNITLLSTIEFIDQRLVSISKELSDVENDFKSYKTSNIVVDLTTQSSTAIHMDQLYEVRLREVEMQLQLLNMVTEYIDSDADDKFSVIPANIGVSDAGLNSIITNYNTMVAERNRMVANSSDTNPRVLNMNTQLADLKRSIEISVDNLVKMYSIRQRELSQSLSQGKSKMADIPEQQFEMQQLNRRLNIIEPLYQLLQKKREEAEIQMYSQVENFRLIEPANGSGAPVGNSSKKIYLLSLLLGCCIPIAVVWTRQQLRSKVESKKDVTDHVDANIMAVLPHATEEGYELIRRNGRDAVCEAFRNLRSNLKYLTDCQVIQVTSSIPGEGKSFVASNMSLSLAHIGKKVLLIGMDIRQPRLNSIFKVEDIDNNNTVVGYMIDKCTDIDKLVHHTSEDHHLDVIFAGPVPPNPTELLSQGKEAEIISHFRGLYDYIIIDSAPMMPVSDSFIINEYVDATIYTIRVNYTPLAILKEIKEAIHSETKPIRRPVIVLNDLDMNSPKYRYGYGEGYGHGSGYGYGYGYGEDAADSSVGQKENRCNLKRYLPGFIVKKK